MNIATKKEIKKHALEVAPKESCGFLYISDKQIFTSRCENISNEPEEEFEINQDDYFACIREARALNGEIVGVYHSGRDAAFSPCDIHNSEELILPLYLYSLNNNSFHTYIPKNYAIDYIGRPFIWGHYDCYTLVKDYYRRECKIYLGDYDCDESYETGRKQDILQNFSKEGFCQSSDLQDIREGDVMLFQCGHEYHVGIYLGSNRFLHQPLRAQSRIEVIDGFWAKSFKSILRHKTKI